jgi:hypothetical protein
MVEVFFLYHFSLNDQLLLLPSRLQPNSLRYWLAGGMYFANENQKFAPFYFRTRTLPANPVHALLGAFHQVPNLYGWNKSSFELQLLGKDIPYLDFILLFFGE